MTQIDQHAVELRGALLVRDVFQGDKQLFQILLVGSVNAGIARRVDPRRAAEGVYGQAGVVGNRGEASYLRSVARFNDRVFDKRQPRLFGGIHAKIGLGDHVQTKII